MTNTAKHETCTNEMEAIMTLINSTHCVESFRIDGNNSSLFAIVMDCEGYFEIMFQSRGGYGLYAKHSDMICSNNRYKTLGGVRRKLRRMGFAA